VKASVVLIREGRPYLNHSTRWNDNPHFFAKEVPTPSDKLSVGCVTFSSKIKKEYYKKEL